MIAILGMGKSGIAVAKYLLQQNVNPIICFDSKAEELKGDSTIRSFISKGVLLCSDGEIPNFLNIDKLILSPGVRSDHLFV